MNTRLLIALLCVGCGVTPVGPALDAGAAEDSGDAPGWDAGPIDPGADRDGDGLNEADEAARGTDPTNEDSDGDGIPDGVEVVAETDPNDPTSSIAATDFYVVLPFEAPEQRHELDFRARLGRGDIMFLIDTTGSMFEPIHNVRASLSRVIVPRIEEAFADARMGVADFQDFPVAPYGGESDHAYQLVQPPTADVDAVHAALERLELGDGGDVPEALLEGVHALATAGFYRPDAQAIIVAITDGQAHNAPGSLPYWDGLVDAVTYEETVDAMLAADVHLAGVAVPTTIGPNVARDDLEELARDTGSLDRRGAPVVRDAPGGGVSASIVGGLADLVASITQDVTSRTVDDPSDGVDGARFVRSVRPLRAEDAERFDGASFYGVAGGSGVVFEVAFRNDFLEPTDEVQIVRASIVLHEPGREDALDTRRVFVLIPRWDGGLI